MAFLFYIEMSSIKMAGSIYEHKIFLRLSP